MDKKIKTVLAAVLGVEPAQISDESSTENLEGWDSLKHMDIIVALEEEFELEFDEEEMIQLTSFAAIREALENKV